MNQRATTLVFIPTYNERENVEPLFQRIMALGLAVDILFMDDNSPDGTGKILDALAVKNPCLTVLHRSGKLGIGSAHQQGIAWAYEQGYKLLVTMDCDFTHPPEIITTLLREKDRADVVVASRYMLKDSLEGWNWLRVSLTHVGHWLTVILLDLPFDATGALRLYHLDRIPAGLFGRVRSRGYSFLYESLFVLYLNRFRIREIPIKLPVRTYGHSKMRLSDAWQSLRLLMILFYQRLFERRSFKVEPAPLPSLPERSADAREWDGYWAQKNSVGRGLYDGVAACYRELIIRPSLNYFVRKWFQSDEEVLHAGCGGGQVDRDVSRYLRVLALDHSVNALRLYQQENGAGSRVLLGSIFKVPLPDHSLDGVYNLGVMEHFTEPDIDNILREFGRLLKPGGKILLFWPPTFGISVVFLGALRNCLSRIMGKDVKLHPDEISRIRSREHVEGIMRRAGFEMLQYYFGPRDLFTCCVLVVRPAAGKISGQV